MSANDLSKGPLDSPPFVIMLNDFLKTSAVKERPDLFTPLEVQMNSLIENGLIPELLLIGGSFLRDHLNAKDLDCIVFYSMKGNQNLPQGFMGNFQLSAKANKVDLKLVPLDHDPIMVVRCAIFYAGLFGRDRKIARMVPHPVLLVDCR